MCVAMLAGLAEARAAVTVKAARMGSTADTQRIVVELDAPVTYKYFTLGNPQRLVVDLDGIDPGAEALKQLAARANGNDPYISEIRVAQNRPGVTRLVAGLKMPMRPLLSLLPAASGFGPRLVIDLVPGASVSASVAPESPAAPPPQAIGKPQPPSNGKAAPAAATTPTAAPAATPKAEAPATPRAPPAETRLASPIPGEKREANAPDGDKPPVAKKTTPIALATVATGTRGEAPEAPRETQTKDVKAAKATTGKENGDKPARPVAEASVSNDKAPPAGAEVATANLAPTPPAGAAGAVAPSAGTDKPVEEKVAAKVATAAPAEVQEKAKPAAKPASLEKQVEQAIRQAERVGDGAGRVKTAKKTADAYKRLITVAIDAGHGGIDPGALGANGSREKDITLAVAQRLKEHLDKREGMRGVLTRDGDYFIPLHERVNKARRAQADLFVSIHADAFLKTTAKGSSVFALSEKGASSAAARWLAKRENDADLIGGVNLDVKDVYLKQTLLDLSQTATIADSLKLGKAVLDELGEINDLHKGKVEQAGFAVLKAPDIPSILVETAFISNPDEEKRLLDEEYQDKLAAAIVSGIRAYFDANPPLARAKVARAD
jgi:N-acetylmuramoyl-L-alanine amidase